MSYISDSAKYAFVSKVLRETDHAVETKDDLTKIEGIGGHIDEDIHEFLATGKIQRLEELRSVT